MNYTHKMLVEIARKWAFNRHGVAVAEFVCMNGEIADVMAFSSVYSTMIECKISRSDFLADKKKFFRRSPEFGMGNYRIYCAPRGVITESDLPDKWALLEVYEGKARLNVNIYKYDQKSIFWHEPTDYLRLSERRVLYSIARRAQIKGLMPKICETLLEVQNV